MPSAYDELLISTAWDKRFDLPTVPIHLNPHIYTAYAVRILESLTYDEETTLNDSMSYPGAQVIRQHYADHFLKDCEDQPGLVRTYPGAGASSHDDAHGAAYLNRGFAERCVDRLSRHDGSYTDGPDSETKNIYRFLFLLPSLKAFAGFRLGLITQLQFVLALMTNLWFTRPSSTDGQLLLWLAFPKMRRYPFMGAFIDYWSQKWEQRGYTPQVIFQKYYLVECPWFGQWARKDWL
jgi:hypothetical protein